MSYLVLARKWRPQTFNDLIGQEHVSLTLKNAIDSGRVAHAFLFTGARGVGKTSSARILAKTLNCENGPTTEPCNLCPACREITDGVSIDVMEIDGASNNGVDEIRELRDNVKYLPSRSRYKIFIIDEVHMLSNSAFNALLKTLEEPPPHIKFIFATTEPHKVPITILSRCQRFDFKRIPLKMILDRLRYIALQESVTISDRALTLVARKGDGSMRDSLSTLDQILAFCGDNAEDADVNALLGVVDRQLLLQALQAIMERDSQALVNIVSKVEESGYNMRHFCQEIIVQMRNLLLCKTIGNIADLVDLSEQELSEVTVLAEKAELQTIQRALAILLKCDSDMSHSPFGRLLLEMALIKMATLSPAIPVTDLLKRLDALENQDGALSTIAADKQPPPYRPATSVNATPPVNAHPKDATPSPAVTIEPLAPPAPHSDWSGFVAFVRTGKPMLASKLDKGSPLQILNGSLQIAYPKGSLELSLLRESDYNSQLTELSSTYFGIQTTVKIVELPADGMPSPRSISEMKELEEAERGESIRVTADSHPLIRAVIETFGGKIESYNP